MGVDSFLNGYFRSNFTFEIQQECRKQGIDINEACQIHFFNANDTVSSYGTIQRPDFPPDPDIAGLGVCLPLL